MGILQGPQLWGSVNVMDKVNSVGWNGGDNRGCPCLLGDYLYKSFWVQLCCNFLCCSLSSGSGFPLIQGISESRISGGWEKSLVKYLKICPVLPLGWAIGGKKLDFSLSQFFLWFLEQSLLWDVFELPLLQMWGAMHPFKYSKHIPGWQSEISTLLV